ncbi:unnamed protein product [Thelazia callipaeda]|uniref:LRRCT domain-containing protein n=1 Tax=Thelazia callipaeda TaxID=103827 RepID=A0A0N5CRR4_THECL|nr:unnamed protein product [Thelazia callipaeda]
MKIFRWNVRLRILDISNLFASSVSRDERPHLLANAFADSVNEFNDLQELIVRNNELEHILPETFCKLNGLIRLHLSGNKLKTFTVKSGCLLNLNLLDLSENKISTLSIKVWENLPSLTTLDISSNPLNCDCMIMPVIKELSKSPSSSLNQGYAICAAPESKKGQNIFEISDFECESNNRLLYLTLLTVLLCIALFTFHTYRHRIKLQHVPVIAGYSKLLGENEQTTDAQFV